MQENDERNRRQKIHSWLKKKYGKASLRKCRRCPKQASDWANVTGKYTDRIKDYATLCRSCHKKMDSKGWRQVIFKDMTQQEANERVKKHMRRWGMRFKDVTGLMPFHLLLNGKIRVMVLSSSQEEAADVRWSKECDIM